MLARPAWVPEFLSSCAYSCFALSFSRGKNGIKSLSPLFKNLENQHSNETSSLSESRSTPKGTPSTTQLLLD